MIVYGPRNDSRAWLEALENESPAIINREIADKLRNIYEGSDDAA